MIQLLEIDRDGCVPEFRSEVPEVCSEGLKATASFYSQVGFRRPWISYLAVRDGQAVGMCAFKGAPRGGRVEVAYGTLLEYEEQGVATAMVAELIRISTDADSTIILTARTLPAEGASTSILKRTWVHTLRHCN
jgi:[ribosomal protein S5]-alanine N-acetyltransferase